MEDGLHWFEDAAEAQQQALQQRRPILIDIYRVPCRGCARLANETFPDPAVAEALRSRFVLLKLNLFEAPREVIRPLHVIWTPTVLITDRRLTEQYRSLNFLPPKQFLNVLDIGEAMHWLHWGQTERAIALLEQAEQREPDGPLAAEAIYRRGIANYLLTRSDPAMYAVWSGIQERFPTSEWAQRIP